VELRVVKVLERLLGGMDRRSIKIGQYVTATPLKVSDKDFPENDAYWIK
jgi:hypothetical protein